MQGLLKDTWTIELSDWIGLKEASEVYRDIESGVRAGESYIVKDSAGGVIGNLRICRNHGLRISFSNVLSEN